jgi:hypothetical protein
MTQTDLPPWFRPNPSVYLVIQSTLAKYITPSYGNSLKKQSADWCGTGSAATTYVDNSVFINSPSYGITPALSSSSASSSSGNSNNGRNIFLTVLFILSLTIGIIIGIFALFDDAYVKFKLSSLNFKMTRVVHPEIKLVYKDWKSKFVQRTYRKLIVKICIFANCLALMITLFYSPDTCILPLATLCICCIVSVVQYCMDFYNDKEIRLYNKLVQLVDIQCNKKDQ